MNFTITEEDQMILDTADKLAEQFPRAYWLENAKKKRFPQEMWDALAEIGYLGITCPEEYGGGGYGMQELAMFHERLSDHGVALLYFVVNQGINVPAITRHGTTEQKERWLPEIAAGRQKFCFAITEPNAGTNTFKIETNAHRDGDDYILNGNKLFISGIDQADCVLVVTRTTSYSDVGKENRKQGMTLLVVPTDASGLSYTPMDTVIENTEGQFFVNFDNVRVPQENRLGDEGKGLHVLFDGLNPERIMVGASACGNGRFCINKAVEYSKTREIFSGPIGAYQGVQHPLAAAKAQIEMASLAVKKAAWLHDNGLPAGDASNMAKLVASDAAYAAADAALQTHGGYGYMESTDILNSVIGARLGKVGPINREMTLNHIAQHVLGMEKSY